jgi:predicted P-loop ATPase
MQNQDQNQTQNQGNDEGWRELNKNGQSEHHNSYTQFGSINKVTTSIKNQAINKTEGLVNDKANTFLNTFGAGRSEVSIGHDIY